MTKETDLADSELVARYVRGDNAAFDALLARYKDRLYNYLIFLTRDAEKADDLFQDVFVKVIMTLQSGRYTESGRFWPWLTRIAYNLMVDRWRDAQSEGLMPLFGDDRAMPLADLAGESREDELLREQTLRDMKKHLHELPKPQREVVYMRYWQDLSFKEIADITGVSINTALGRMRYALLALRRMMA